MQEVRKRGRPKKNINFNITEISKLITNKQEEIVLFLPISFDDEKKEDNEPVLINKNDDTDNLTNDKPYCDTNKLKSNMVDLYNDKIMKPEPTDISCWWCAHNFTNNPIHIPDKYIDEKYYVFGFFCSLNCAAAYIIDNNDYKMYTRYSFFLKMYELNEIKCSPDWKYLKKFGGNLTIEEFRTEHVLPNKYPNIIQLAYTIQ